MKIQKVLIMALAVCSGSINAGKLDGDNCKYLQSSTLHETINSLITTQTRLSDAKPVENIDDVSVLADSTVTYLATSAIVGDDLVNMTMLQAFDAVQKAWTPADLKTYPATITTLATLGTTAKTNIETFSGNTDFGAALTAIKDGINDAAAVTSIQAALTSVKSAIDKTKTGNDVIIKEGIGVLGTKVGYAGSDLTAVFDAAIAAIDAATPASMSDGLKSVTSVLTGDADYVLNAKLEELSAKAQTKGLAGLSAIELANESIRGRIASLLKLFKQLGDAGGLGVLSKDGSSVNPVSFEDLVLTNMFTVINKILTVRAG